MSALKTLQNGIFSIFSVDNFKKLFPHTMTALLLAGICLMSYFKVFEAYELQTYDWRCQNRGARPLSPQIVFIDISVDTVATLGAWPFSREFHGNLIDYLSICGAKAIVFDVFFSEPRPDEDDYIVKAAKKSKNVYFPIAFSDPKYDGKRYTGENIQEPLLTEFSAVAKGVGFVNIVADLDGKRRRVAPIMQYHGEDFYQLSVKVAADVLGIGRDRIVLEPNHCVRLGDVVRIPLDDQGCMVVNFGSVWQDPATFKQHVSYGAILRSFVQESVREKPDLDVRKLVKDKLCIVGLTLAGSVDTNAIPLQPVYPMVGIHANILSNILEKDFICRLDRVSNLLILLILGVVVCVLTARLRPLRALCAVIGSILVYVLVIFLIFKQWGLWIDLFYPVILMPAVYAVTILLKVIKEIRKRQLVENELAVASQIQKSFLPEKAPAHEGLEVEVFMKPAKAIGGDLYAFVPLKDGSLGVMVGDVSGKGTPAALFMAKVVSEFKFFAKDQSNPAEVLARLNDAISAESTSGLFVTVCYAIFDIRGRRMVISNGGHLPIVRSAADKSEDLLTADAGMPIGVMEKVEFANFEVELADGDALAFYTDGVSEGRNKKQEEFGVETLQRVVAQHRAESARQILDSAVGQLTDFMGNADQHDDITLIVVKIAAKDKTV